MRKRVVLWVALAAALSLGLPGLASASTTLGITSPPLGSSAYGCVPGPPTPSVFQYAQDASTPYMVPSGGGPITSWQTYTAGDAPGSALTFFVLQPASGGNYTVVGTDSETLPNPLPADNVATFDLATPIAAAAGDTVGLYSTSDGVNCYWSGGATPLSDELNTLATAGQPMPGQTLGTTFVSGGGATMNLAYTLGALSEDAGVATAASPSNATAGDPALLSATVTNNGPGQAPITFTDNVPAGLTIDSASAGNGTCSTAGQVVTCTVTGLSVGQSAPVNIIVTPAKSGHYVNSVTVAPASGVTDPNPSNNSASATLTVVAAGPTKCTVPRLKGVSLSTAKKALKLLGCKIGKVHHVASSVTKGRVAKTTVKAGGYAPGKVVGIDVSSGSTTHAMRRAALATHLDEWNSR